MGGGWATEAARQRDNAAFLDGALDDLRTRRREGFLQAARAAGTPLPDAVLRAIYAAAWAGEAWVAATDVARRADALALKMCERQEARARRIPFPAPVTD